ncbi:tyrosinase family oxidase copper chaperone [Actinosynnema sp. NPDC020468]|uniref:tyrosinase family oxidase copper chaperone n=1 Tax=Actinosynnema sp. NPDC020468 TaxID=3154488 RepID=UPI0033E13EAC
MTVNRRDVLKVALMGTATAGLTAVAGVVATKTFDGAAADEGHTETYRGRRIWVGAQDGDPAATVDGRPLHLMRLGDNAYLSSLCHYGAEPTPLAAARRAVDELRGANLLPASAHHH